jgi:hypothetical protein
VVSDSPSGSNEFGDVQSAVDEAEAGAVIGIDGSFSPSPGSQINIDVEDVTLTGFNGKPTVDLTGASPSGTSAGAVQVSASGVTLRNFNIDYEADANGIEANNAGLSDITVDGMRVKNTVKASGKPAINLEKVESVTVTNNEVLGAAIGTFFTTGNSNTSTISNNYIDLNPDDNAPESGGPTEGIFAFGSNVSNTDFEIRNNEVINHNIADVAAKEIKVIDNPASVNGESDAAAQIESLLTENSVNSAQVNSDSGTRATPDIVGAGQQFASVNEVLQPSVKGEKGSIGEPAGSGLVALFEDGEYGSDGSTFDSELTHDKAGAVIKGLGSPTVVFTGMDETTDNGSDVELIGNNTVLEGLTLEFRQDGDEGVSVGGENALRIAGKNATLQNAEIRFRETPGFEGGTAGFISVEGSSESTVTFQNSTLALLNEDGDPYTNGGAAGKISTFVSAGDPRIAQALHNNGGTFKVLDCTFRGGARLDVNVGDSGTAIYKRNSFEEKPGNSPEAIQGTPSGGTIDIADNLFSYDNGGNERIKLNGYTESDVNGVDDRPADKAADTLSEANGPSDAKDVEVLVDGVRVGGDEG